MPKFVQTFRFDLYHEVVDGSRVDSSVLGRSVVNPSLNIPKTTFVLLALLSPPLSSREPINTLGPT